MKVYFFGCWNEPGHFLHAPGGRRLCRDVLEYYGDHTHLDGTLAPRRMRRGGAICWTGMGSTPAERQRIGSDSDESPQGQYVRHELTTGYTAIQWWDREQGDPRGACNSTILVAGRQSSPEMLTALREHFPHVAANLGRAGVLLLDVTP